MGNRNLSLSESRFMLLAISRLLLILFALSYYIYPWFLIGDWNYYAYQTIFIPLTGILFLGLAALLVIIFVFIMMFKLKRVLFRKNGNQDNVYKPDYTKPRFAFVLNRFRVFNIVIYVFSLLVILAYMTSRDKSFPILFQWAHPVIVTVAYYFLNRYLIRETYAYFYPIFKADIEMQKDAKLALNYYFDVIMKKTHHENGKWTSYLGFIPSEYSVEAFLRYKKLPIYVHLIWMTDSKYQNWRVFGK